MPVIGTVQFNDGTTQTTKFDSTLDTGTPISINYYDTAGAHTWTKPTGCTNVLVKVVGGGGGAAGYCESGGGGGYSEENIDVSAVSTVAVTVGGGGGAVGYYAAAGDGSTSSFGSYCSASGGYGANRNYSHTGGHGGVGSNGGINLYGGDGTGHANSMGNFPGGTGGGTYLGGSSTVNRATTTTQTDVGSPGCGGPGGRTNNGSAVSNPGQPGAVIVYSFK